MHHLIIGYGYCGFYLAQHLLSQGQKVATLSRQLNHNMQLPGVAHLCQDLQEPLIWNQEDTILYYLVPPPKVGLEDRLLQHFLSINTLKLKKVIYFGSSGVYGDHQGAWIDEQAACHLQQARQYSRLHAEALWQDFCDWHRIPAIILRVAGIYGPGRLPLQQARAKSAIIYPREAPYTNHIYVKDLVKIAEQLATEVQSSTVYNIADGQPSLMGTLQQEVTQALGLEPASYETFTQAWKKASPMKQEFMQASKRLRIQALQTTLRQNLNLTALSQAVRESLEKETLE